MNKEKGGYSKEAYVQAELKAKQADRDAETATKKRTQDKDIAVHKSPWDRFLDNSGLSEYSRSLRVQGKAWKKVTNLEGMAYDEAIKLNKEYDNMRAVAADKIDALMSLKTKDALRDVKKTLDELFSFEKNKLGMDLTQNSEVRRNREKIYNDAADKILDREEIGSNEWFLRTF